MFTNSQNRSLLLTLFTVFVLGSLFSALFVLTLRNEISFEEAIQKGHITATIRGATEDGRFTQPMLQLHIKNQSYLPLTVVMNQGVQFESTTGHGNVMTLHTQRIPIFWPQRTVRIFAYTQDYTKRFPDIDARYQLSTAGIVELPNSLQIVLNNIEVLQAQGEISGQLAVWRILQNVELDQLEPILGHRFPLDTHLRVEELISQNLPLIQPVSSILNWLAFEILFTLLSFVFGSLYWRSVKNTNRSLVGVIDEFGGKLVHHLSEWQLLVRGKAVEVWTAVDTRQNLDKPIIVKFPRQDVKKVPRGQEDVRLEATMEQHQQLEHPNIVQLLEAGQYIHPVTNQKTDYLIQEFVEGYTLQSFVDRQSSKRLPNELITTITSQILDALSYMHTEKIVHRTLTLNDVMINQTGQVYLVNFANAILGDINEASYIDLSAPSAPMSIEDMFASDLYSLAIMVSVMYGCQLPTSTNAQDVQRSVEQQLQGRADVPEWVCNTIHKCLNLEYHDNITLNDFVYMPE